jgi:hypothetical protein
VYDTAYEKGDAAADKMGKLDELYNEITVGGK